MTQKARTFRSPLKAAPLHNPGQSLDLELMSLREEKILPWFIIALSSTLWGSIDLWRWYANQPIHPSVAISLLLFGWIGFAWVYVRSLRKARQLQLGRDGERAVGQYLERLRESGAQIYHDVPGDKFNLDHVIISTQGIFVVETKTLQKPAKGKAEIVARQGELYANGKKIERNPIEQTRALAEWLQNLLQESTGKQFAVQPTVVFPGWYVHRVNQNAAKGVWVLNPKALPAFIASVSQRLSPEDVRLVAYHLSRHIRAQA